MRNTHYTNADSNGVAGYNRLIPPGRFAFGANSASAQDYADIPEEDRLGTLYPFEESAPVADEGSPLPLSTDPRNNHFTDEEFERIKASWVNAIKQPFEKNHIHSAHGVHAVAHNDDKFDITRDHVTIGNSVDDEILRGLALHAKTMPNFEGKLAPKDPIETYDPKQLLQLWAHCQVHGVEFSWKPSDEDARKMQDTITRLRAEEVVRQQAGTAQAAAPQQPEAAQTPAHEIQTQPETTATSQPAESSAPVQTATEAPQHSIGSNDEQLGHAIAQLNPEEEGLRNDWAHHVNAEQLGHMAPKLNPEETMLGDAWANHVSPSPQTEAGVAAEVGAQKAPAPQPEVKTEPVVYKAGPYIIKKGPKGPGAGF